MFNLFIKHPRENGFDGYFSHMKFAMFVSLRFAMSTLVFLVHSIFPFISIPKFLNFEATILFLIDKNNQLD